MQLVTENFVVEEGVDQHYEVLKELGDCHASLGNYDRARQCYEEAALLAPKKPGPIIGLGVVGIQTGGLDQAERAFHQALEIDPECGEAYGGLAMIYQRRRDYSRAFDMYLACLNKDVDNLVALFGLFQTSCQMGSFAKVIHYLEVYLGLHPDDTSVLFCLATLYARDGRLCDAAQALETVLALESDNADAAGLLNDIHRKQAEAGA